MLELLDEVPLDRITVLAITKRAHIHRATFSRHYPTREALLDAVAADQIDRLIDLTIPVLDRASSGAAVAALLEYVLENRNVWESLLKGAYSTMRERLMSRSLAIAEARVPGGLTPPVSLTTRYSVSLILDSLSWWLGRPDAEAVIARLGHTLQTLLSAIQKSGDHWTLPISRSLDR